VRRSFNILALLICCSVLSSSTEGGSRLQKQSDNNSTDRTSAQKSSEQKAAASSDGKSQQVIYQGIAVGMSATSLAKPTDPSAGLHAGDDVTFQFKINDTATGAPLTGAFPRAWLDLDRPMEKIDCVGKVRAFVASGLLTRPLLDLNTYYVLALNEDASISVIDPHFGYGGSKLLTMVSLKSPGEDWALSPDSSMLFVSMPDVQKIAAISTATWKVVADIDVGARPSRLALQPDRGRLWVTYDVSKAGGQESGVTVIDTEKLAIEAKLKTGRGSHEIALSDDGRFAFVTNSDDDYVSIIDAIRLAKIKDVRTGRKPSSVAFSSKAKMAYVVHEEDDRIVALDAISQKLVATISSLAGPGQMIRFAPDGRFAFIPNPSKNAVLVLDAALNKIVQTANIDLGPDQISFSDKLGYIRRRDSEIVLMMPLPRGDVQGHTVTLTDFPGGQHPFGKAAKPSLASSIVRAPGDNAALVANAADKSIYYYQEGMAAPMGSFSNYGHEPRAVLVVDRSLRERAPGVYETTARVDSSGQLTIAFVLDSPRIVHCFPLRVAASSNPLASSHNVRVEGLIKEQIIRVGDRARVRFKLSDANTAQLKSNLRDVSALVFLAPGIWQNRPQAREVEPGTYEVEFEPPQTGFYYVYIQSPALGLTLDNPRYVILEAVDRQGQ